MLRADLDQRFPHVADVEGARTNPDGEGRLIEDWIVGTLDARLTVSESDDFRTSSLYARRDTTPATPSHLGTGKMKTQGWKRFRLTHRNGVTIVVLTDLALLKADDLGELQADISALIEAGHHQLVLNFAAVERLSTWTAGAVAETLRRCTAARGGALRVCGLRSGLASVFAITGQAREIAIYQDEAAAVEAPWPARPEFRPLPLDILTALTRVEEPPIPEKIAPVRAFEVDSLGPPFDEETLAMSRVRLISDRGPTKGKAVTIAGSRFVIGRDPTCNLHPNTPSISRFHVAIERRSGRIFLRDLGSMNGTMINGRTLRGDETEIRHGDRIEVGSLRFTLEVGSGTEVHAGVDDLVVSWLWNSHEGTTLQDFHETTTDDLPLPDTINGFLPPKHEVIAGVLVVTPVIPDLDDEPTIGPLRTKLISLLDSSTPRRVVLNLSHIGHLSGQAIGVIVAHYLRLHRAGGSLRICEANPRVAAVLDQVRLGMLVEYHPTIDDAVLTPWPPDKPTL